MNKYFADDLDTDLARGHVLEWAELYALDAIGEDERRAIDTFLDAADPRTAAAFADRVRTSRETVTSVYATDQIEPPGDLFERIIAQLPDQGRHGPQGLTAPTDGVSAAEDELADRRAARAATSSRGSRWIMAAAAAAVIVVGGVTVAQNMQPSSVEDQVLQASDVTTEELTLDQGGVAVLSLSGDQDAAVLTLNDVPSPADGFVYQMWRVPADGSDPISVGTMTGDDLSGGVVTELSGINDLVALAITVEPEGGSATPTLPIVVEIPLGA